MNDVQKAQICEWLRTKRNGRSYVAFSREMCVAKSSLQRYEAGDSNPPAALVLRWQTQFPDFPQLGYAVAERPATDHRVMQDLPVYGEAVLGIRVDIDKVRRISVTLNALFQQVGLGKEHRPFRDVLFSVMERDTISSSSLGLLVHWYCDEVVNAKADAAQ